MDIHFKNEIYTLPSNQGMKIIQQLLCLDSTTYVPVRTFSQKELGDLNSHEFIKALSFL